MLHRIDELIFHHHRQVNSINALFLNSTIRSVSISLFGIFVPIYLFQLYGNIKFVLLYFLISRLSAAFLCFPIGKIVARLGFAISVFISNIFLTSYLLALIFLKDMPTIIYFVGAAEVFALLFYWLPFHILVIDDSDKERMGHEISLFNILTHIAHVVPPFLGGFIILIFGFPLLYAFAIIFALISSIPLFFIPVHRKPVKLEYLRFFNTFNLPRLSIFLNGFEDVFIGVVWPVFMFIVLSSFEQIGTFTSIMLAISSFFIVILGYYMDHGRSQEFYKFGSLLSAAFYPLRALLVTPLGILFVDSSHSIIRLTQKLPFDLLVYRNSPQGFEYEYVVFREFYLTLGRALAAFFAILAFVGELSWNYIFLIPALANVFMLIYSREFKPPSKN